MDLVITGHQLDLTPELRMYVLKKLKSAWKSCRQAVNRTRILLTGPEKNGKGFRGANQKVAIELSLNGIRMFISHVHEDLYAAIDLLFDKVSRRLRDYKEKKRLAHQKRLKKRTHLHTGS